MDGYKLWYSGSDRHLNSMGILVDEELRAQVMDVKRVCDRLMMIKLVIGGFTQHVYSVYAPQVGLGEKVKVGFREALDEVGGYDDMHRGFGFGDRNEERAALLDFVKALGLVVVNPSFLKKENHLITFQSAIAKTQIDFMLLRMGDRVLRKDCKVIPSEHLSTKHRLLVMDLFMKKSKKRKVEEGRPTIRWGGLTPDSALKIEEKLTVLGV
ncbi:uncharacterized protein LOC107874418 [Capsicum annuum]|uniref:uncharacterized protein LOC107874418 n=1 Tax=Capsicum annuum TaxID=4072 RepID=UPI001FB1079D|nr:uncharacterized protein LOC107874418 [Capsicum annuum]